MTAPRKAFTWNEIPPERECAPTFSLNHHIALARKEMGEARWAELNAEWASPKGEQS